MPSTELTAVPWNHQTNINTMNNNQSWSSGWSRANYSEQATITTTETTNNEATSTHHSHDTTTTNEPSKTPAWEGRENHIVAVKNWFLIRGNWTSKHRKQKPEEWSVAGSRATGATWTLRPSHHVSLLLLEHVRSICTTNHKTNCHSHYGTGRSRVLDIVDHQYIPTAVDQLKFIRVWIWDSFAQIFIAKYLNWTIQLTFIIFMLKFYFLLIS